MIMKVSSTCTNRLGKRRRINERGKAAKISICPEKTSAINNVFLKKVLSEKFDPDFVWVFYVSPSPAVYFHFQDYSVSCFSGFF